MFKKYDTVKLTLSEDWLETLMTAIERNTDIAREPGLSERSMFADRNGCILDKLKKYAKEDGTVYLFKNEAAEIIWILLENFSYLEDFRDNAMGLLSSAAEKIKTISEGMEKGRSK